ncbi:MULTISPECIES: TetR/AcrR family transcriptional regulator C-terminal domain-containing protein [Streptomyces]|uniref:TetR/AcrR family transcriptional regulator C-terminal domain-containing protein n=1 Tax=Streptomyces TaxID=1883 RepID=UPI000FB445FC|nr:MULTISPECIES: hypothetical protein [unclassified Streptomyces]MDX3066377.1 hypothetical protein [Streptomyces sp. ND04-05B]RPK79370.1 hypothetical protein EES45_16140 [Streptomyces sp. ADI97-07]WRY83314.1 hypothetical protein OG388_19880 [Streptomyces clavifer]
MHEIRARTAAPPRGRRPSTPPSEQELTLDRIVHARTSGWRAAPPALRDLAESGRFPTFAKIVGAFEDGYDLRLDILFELGLTALLDGLAPVVEGRPDEDAQIEG